MPKTHAEYRWTERKLAEFLACLGRTGSVTTASGQVGMSRQSAYVRARKDRAFASGWDRAIADRRMALFAQNSVNRSTSSTCASPAAAPLDGVNR